MHPLQQHDTRQMSYLYDVRWTPEIDNVFIDTLAFQARIGNFVPGEGNLSAVVCARGAIHRRCNVDYTIDACMTRVEKLSKRYTTIAWMTSLSLVQLDTNDNVIYAPNVTWDFIVKVYISSHSIQFHNYLGKIFLIWYKWLIE